MTYHNSNRQSKTGFALLLSLIVVSVVVSVGLTVLDLSMKQVRLSTNSKESEIAFHAANAGLECARYWRIAEAVDMEAGTAAVTTCFGETPDSSTFSVPSFIGLRATVYETEFTWGPTAARRCSHMKTLVIVSDVAATTTVTGMQALMPGYPYGNSKSCEPGARCTILSVQGYSKACSSIGTVGTVERQVLLEL